MTEPCPRCSAQGDEPCSTPSGVLRDDHRARGTGATLTWTEPDWRRGWYPEMDIRP